VSNHNSDECCCAVCCYAEWSNWSSSVTCQMNCLCILFVYERWNLYDCGLLVLGPISPIGVFHYIRWSCCIFLWFVLKLEAACCCEVLVTTLKATRFHNPEDHSLYFLILRSFHLIVVFQVAFFLWCFDFDCVVFNT